MMAEHTHLIWTLVLLLLSDVISSDWDVHVEPVLCAVKGSSIDIPCSFTYPVGQTVKNVAWAHHEAAFVKGPFVFESTSEPTSTKFQYLGDKLHNCSLRIYKVENRDAGDYAFRFWTDRDRWTGYPGVNLNVSDLKIIQSNGNKVITEGDNVKLTCIIGCKDHSHFQWYKNGHPIIEGPSLYWNNISSNNSGNYSCSIKTHPQATPGVVSINVEYGPKNTSVSAEPGLEVYRGSKVTLTCSSDANPPVETFTWFKITSDHLVKVAGNKSELVFWECPQDAEGRYFCCATNKHGSKNSSVVELTVTDSKHCHVQQRTSRTAQRMQSTSIGMCLTSANHKREIRENNPSSKSFMQLLTSTIRQRQICSSSRRALVLVTRV
ncbi:B-cell receptor CD22-like isoform X2 [Cynoglossus semilaevis]|uniref:B-cell receptor CD22-like isoform X2 n=1 Tax=Cynoglossus semilaevis TaxID=244447 RepID=UPI000D6231B8|nr:B-cell receptor CD22-like isoform X2 [Cynoglossus semilaevis]